MTDDEQDFFNKSIGKLEKEIISLKKEYQAECHRADELEDSLQKSWQNESKLKELLKRARGLMNCTKDWACTEATEEMIAKIDSAIGEDK